MLLKKSSKIDYGKVKEFWEAKAEAKEARDPLVATTFCTRFPDGYAEYRNETEKRHIFKKIRVGRNDLVLDLGCGVGGWAIEFAKKCAHVVAVDFSPKLLDLAKETAEAQHILNIEFICSSAINFSYPVQFDLIFLGGLFKYLNDEDVEKVIAELKKLLKPNGKIISRESINISEAQFRNEYDKTVEMVYQAKYRRPEEYTILFASNGFDLIYEMDTCSRLIPFSWSLYNHFLPPKIKTNKIVLSLARWELNCLARIDFLLLRFRIFRHYRRGAFQRFFIYQHATVF